MNSPCELCYIKFGKEVTDECDKNCEFAKMEKENKALKNQCFVLGKGMLCAFCPMNCEHRTVGFRDEDPVDRIMSERDTN